jgi:hypothetical protein
MKDTVSDPPPLSPHQDELLEGIKYCIEQIQIELQRLPTSPQLLRLRRDIDNLTVKAIRSLLWRVPGKKGFPGLSLRVIKDIESGGEDDYQFLLEPGDDIKYHPRLPLWALHHFCNWIMDKRFLPSNDDINLLAKCKMGLETGLKLPLDYDLLERVLRFRGFDMHSEKDLKKIRKIEGINKSKRGRPKKQVRKEGNSWDQIASRLGKLAEEGSLPTTGEGLKIMLQNMFPEIDFDKV